MNASSHYFRSDHGGFYAYYGRLNGPRSWCAQTRDGSQDWLQVDPGKITEICGIASQGNGASYQAWVTDFKLSSSATGNSWTTYSDGSEMVSLDILE